MGSQLVWFKHHFMLEAIEPIYCLPHPRNIHPILVIRPSLGPHKADKVKRWDGLQMWDESIILVGMVENRNGQFLEILSTDDCTEDIFAAAFPKVVSAYEYVSLN